MLQGMLRDLGTMGLEEQINQGGINLDSVNDKGQDANIQRND
jgi:hypothetical protein